MGYFINDAEQIRRLISGECWESLKEHPQTFGGMIEYRAKRKPKEDTRKPKRYISATKAIIRLRKIEGDGYGDEIVQRQGIIYKLDDKDPSALALYGGHQVIVLDDNSFDIDEWMIVSVTELW